MIFCFPDSSRASNSARSAERLADSAMLADEEVDAAGDPPDVSMASVDEDILEETNFDEKTLDFFTTKSFDFETLFNKIRKSHFKSKSS